MRFNTGLGFMPLIAAAPATGPAAPFLIAASFAPLAFKAISGLWTKDECKVEYDAARQKFYDFEAGLLNVDPVNSWDAWKKAGTLTYDRGAWIINQMSTALNQFSAYTDQAKRQCDPNWIDPRFHDYYDFFTGVVNSLKAQLPALDPNRGQPAGILQGVGSAIASLVNPTPGSAYLPQAGTLPPVNTLPAVYTTGGPAATEPPPFLLVAGGLALGLFLFSKFTRQESSR